MSWYVLDPDTGTVGGPFSRDDAETYAEAVHGLIKSGQQLFPEEYEPIVVTCSMEGGVIEFDEIPAGVEVHLADYDCEGWNSVDELEQDAEGRDCKVTKYVHMPKHAAEDMPKHEGELKLVNTLAVGVKFRSPPKDGPIFTVVKPNFRVAESGGTYFYDPRNHKVEKALPGCTVEVIPQGGE